VSCYCLYDEQNVWHCDAVSVLMCSASSRRLSAISQQWQEKQSENNCAWKWSTHFYGCLFVYTTRVAPCDLFLPFLLYPRLAAKPSEHAGRREASSLNGIQQTDVTDTRRPFVAVTTLSLLRKFCLCGSCNTVLFSNHVAWSVRSSLAYFVILSPVR
jgi:hypothetical protein